MSNTLLSKKDFFDSFFNSSLDIVAKRKMVQKKTGDFLSYEIKKKENVKSI